VTRISAANAGLVALARCDRQGRVRQIDRSRHGRWGAGGGQDLTDFAVVDHLCSVREHVAHFAAHKGLWARLQLPEPLLDMIAGLLRLSRPKPYRPFRRRPIRDLAPATCSLSVVRPIVIFGPRSPALPRTGRASISGSRRTIHGPSAAMGATAHRCRARFCAPNSPRCRRPERATTTVMIRFAQNGLKFPSSRTDGRIGGRCHRRERSIRCSMGGHEAGAPRAPRPQAPKQRPAGDREWTCRVLPPKTSAGLCRPMRFRTLASRRAEIVDRGRRFEPVQQGVKPLSHGPMLKHRYFPAIITQCGFSLKLSQP